MKGNSVILFYFFKIKSFKKMNKIITVHYSCMDSLKEGITEKANVGGGAENLTTAEKSVCLQVL